MKFPDIHEPNPLGEQLDNAGQRIKREEKLFGWASINSSAKGEVVIRVDDVPPPPEDDIFPGDVKVDIRGRPKGCGHATVRLSPHEAKKLARKLVEAADRALDGDLA